jgi:thiol-disulfide isomerase/thioredoxin
MTRIEFGAANRLHKELIGTAPFCHSSVRGKNAIGVKSWRSTEDWKSTMKKQANPMRRLAFVGLLMAALPAWAQGQEKAKATVAEPQSIRRAIRGKVVDETDKPVAGADLSRLWYTSKDQEFTPYEPVKTAADGTFTIDLTFYYGRPYVLATFDTERRRGGMILVGAKASKDPITIKVSALVHLHGSYQCKDLGKPVGWTNTILFAMPDRINFSNYQSDNSRFDFWLPPGSYQVQGYGASDFGQIKREITLDAAKPDLDLGAIDLAASKLAKLKGKAAPELLSTDARGVKKNPQIADFHGKWVVLEFWGYWCGPCVGRALPQLMDIYDDHADERDKYIILTVHAPDTKTFAELDERVKPVVRDTWDGRMMPFPILLDADSKIQETFGVSHWPTTLLFDPDGKLVGEVQPEQLEGKLKKIPLAVDLPRKLDRLTLFSFNNGTLKDAFTTIKRWTHIDCELAQAAVSSMGVSESTAVPLVLSGRLSLRSIFALLLDPLDLAAEIGPNGYVITRRAPSDSVDLPGLTKLQQTSAVRIEKKLKASRASYDFNNTPLAKVAAFFEEQSDENVVLDPRGRLQGKIDPDRAISGSGKNVPLGEALEKLVGPLGLHVVVRNEVILLEAR